MIVTMGIAIYYVYLEAGWVTASMISMLVIESSSHNVVLKSLKQKLDWIYFNRLH